MLNKIKRKLKIKSTALFAVLLIIAAIALIFAIAAFVNQSDFFGQRNQIIILEGVDTRAEIPAEIPHGTETLTEIANESIMIHISGEVKTPGVFWLNDGDRVWDAVEAAGGLTPYADQNSINLARVLRDEDHIIIRKIGENVTASQNLTTSHSGLININTANSVELQTLSGIGSATAANIISHREARGGFDNIEEIMNVSGIGERIFENIKDNITVN